MQISNGVKFLEKIRNLPEQTRKVILWATVIVLALIMLFFWVRSIPQRLGSFQAGQFFQQLGLPKIAIPQMPELPNLNKIETNATTETQIQEN